MTHKEYNQAESLIHNSVEVMIDANQFNSVFELLSLYIKNLKERKVEYTSDIDGR